MVIIDTTPPTIAAIYTHYETRPNRHRLHLGASEIGMPCDRALWYRFRHVLESKHPGRVCRLFETGHREEARVIQNLRDIGIEVCDRIDGHQIHYRDPDCVWFTGSLDGMARGFVEAPKSWHVVEIKTASKKQFDRLENKGVRRHKPEHWAQVQMYMHWSGVKRAYYLCVCKDDDRIYGERFAYDKPTAAKLTERAHRIINAPEPPEVAYTPKRPPCLWCDYAELCAETRVPDINCRTCCHWYCDCTGERCVLGLEIGKLYCDRHMYIPALVPAEVVDVYDNRIVWRVGTDEIATGPGHNTSEYLRQVISNLG